MTQAVRLRRQVKVLQEKTPAELPAAVLHTDEVTAAIADLNTRTVRTSGRMYCYECLTSGDASLSARPSGRRDD